MARKKRAPAPLQGGTGTLLIKPPIEVTDETSVFYVNHLSER
jgi:hypothetical protein